MAQVGIIYGSRERLFSDRNELLVLEGWPLPLPRHILSVAPNRCLRTTREEIFERAGYAVTSLSSIFDALRKLSGNGDAFDIVVVCGCIPAEERSRFIATIKATSPTTPILLIGEEREPLTDDAVRGLDGPELLLNHVAGLLAR